MLLPPGSSSNSSGFVSTRTHQRRVRNLNYLHSAILWVLWLATGALTANDTSGVFVTCKFGNPILDQFCHETLSIEAFSFLAWIALFAYTTTLLIVALINASRGAPIWKSTVRQSGTVPAAPAAQSQEPTLQYNPNAFAPQSQSYPMQQQQQQQPYGVPGQQWSPPQQQQQQPFATPQGQPPIQQYQPVPLHDTQHYTPPSQLQAQYTTPQPAPSPAASNLSYQPPSSLSGRPPSNFSGHPQV